MKQKTFYYKDEVNDDFAKTHLKRPNIDENYKFIRSNKVNNFFSALLYYIICVPILATVSKIDGVKVKGRYKLKAFRNKPIFIYANHTSYLDSFVIQSLVCGYKRTNIIGYSDATTIPIAKHIARAAGYLPIPSTPKATAKFLDAIRYYTEHNQNILIYPEAHIWPTYTKIRPFLKTSFHYPAKLHVPVIPIVTVYRKSKLSKHPKMTLVVGDPIYPIDDLNDNENKQYLRDSCYEQMRKISSFYNQYEYHKFVNSSNIQ